MKNVFTVVITGANRGIGLELTRQFCQSRQWMIIACCRAPGSATELHRLADQFSGQVSIHPLAA